jgi:zinc protease
MKAQTFQTISPTDPKKIDANKPPKFNDPLNAVVRTLPNGLTLYLSPNKDEPRVQTYIAVKAGSKFDPADNTGLAHYLEHMMFKGTHNIGTKNWEEEKKILDKISTLYEKHKAEKDPEKKKAIYQEIDKTSYEASKLAIPNEYDKMISSLGAKGTNAYTSNDQTVYINDIPANELEKWMSVESERFQTLVLRLFHTELEAVYEEYNISLENDSRWAYANMFKMLFPNHPYGTQTTIGLGDHLKNPSMVNIHNYYDKYYVPNNIAICIAGDFDVNVVTEMAERYFGGWEKKSITPFVEPVVPELKAPVSMENWGQQDEFVFIGFRMPKATSKECLKLKLIDQILSNGKAGLIDLNINQSQKALGVYSSYNTMNDHSVHMLYGKPRQGQTLDQVKDLLLAEIENIKNGNFEEWLIEASINDMKIEQLKSLESNRNRAGAFVEAFTNGWEWRDYITQIDNLKGIMKADLVAFAKKYYGQNYAVSYKRKGENKDKGAKVDKPKITSIVMNRDESSQWALRFFSKKSSDIQPEYVNYEGSMRMAKVAGKTDMYNVPNQTNELNKYTLIIEQGSDHNLLFPIAAQYLQYLGTDKLSGEQFKKELYKLGLTISASSSRDRTSISLFGLEKNLEKGIDLMYKQINTCKEDKTAFSDMIKGFLKQRINAKTDKNTILGNLVNYVKFGTENPAKNIISEDNLSMLNPKDVIDFIHTWGKISNKIFFYGNKDIRSIVGLNHMDTSKTFIPSPTNFEFQSTEKGDVLFYNYPGMVQAQIMMVSRGRNFEANILSNATLFSDYFGGGLSSIVFQEIREQKALAYSAYSTYRTPEKSSEPHFLSAFVGTQADKMETALTEMLKLLGKMPRVERQFESARTSAMKQIASERITKENIFNRYDALKKLGINYDIRENIYRELNSANMNSFESWFNKYIAPSKYTFIVLGDKSKLNMESLAKFGKIKELSPEDVFRY